MSNSYESNFKKYEEYSNSCDEVKERVMELRKEYDLINKERFSQATGLSIDTVKGKDSKKKNTPYTIDELLKICNLFEVDLDYLLGKQDERTHVVKDIKQLTGLSEEASNIIANYVPDVPDFDLRVRFRKGAINCLSWLIEHGLLPSLFHINEEAVKWWSKYDYAPSSREKVKRQYAEQCDDGYSFFSDEEKEEAWIKADNDYTFFKVRTDEEKENIIKTINEYFEVDQATLFEVPHIPEEKESEVNNG